MMFWRIGVVFAFLWAALSCLAETPEALFQRGVESFKQEDWQTAIASWQEIERRGLTSGPLCYDLGNAHYRIGAIGKSIVYYRRALRMMPRDADVRQNLELARMAVVDRIEPPVRLAVWDWIDRARDLLNLHELFRIMVTVGLLAVTAIGVWALGPLSVRRYGRTTAILLVCAYVIVTAWYTWRSVLDSKTRAVVLETKVDVFSAPDSSATQVFTLHEGTEVSERQSVAGWSHIVLADGRAGWLPSETVEQI